MVIGLGQVENGLSLDRVRGLRSTAAAESFHFGGFRPYDVLGRHGEAITEKKN